MANAASNLGKWEKHYRDLDAPMLYGDATTYALAADYLSDVAEVEDWGCGAGGFRQFCRVPYLGVDGSASCFADRIVDLETYRSDADGILLRHILEHNYAWRAVLANALASFRSKLCLVLFTPFAEETCEIAYHEAYGVPDIAFAKDELIAAFGGLDFTLDEGLETDTIYGVEHVFYLRR